MGDRVLRRMPPVLLCALFVWVVARATRPIQDPDDWWHLRLGNDLINQHSLAAPPHWSGFATVAWVPTEPLPEVVGAVVDRWAGLPGLAVLYAVACLLVVLAVYRTSRQEAAPLPAAVTTILAVLAASASLTSRPQLVSFVLFPVVVAAWLRTERDHRARWWLIPLVWVWSLCHGFWFLGAAYGVVFVVGFALSRRMSRSVLVKQAAIAVGSVLVVTLNPVGLGVFEAPFAVNSTSQYIQEWARTDLGSAAALGALAMVGTTAAIWATTRRGATWSRALLLLSAVFWIWYAGRTVAVAGLVTAPVLAAALDQVTRTGQDRPESGAPPRPRLGGEVTFVALAAVLAAALVGVLAPTTSDRPGDVPTALDPTLDRLPAGTRVFNAYELGGWIAWRHPDLEQYIDGLITPYSVSHADDYYRAVTLGSGWYRVVQDSHAPVALLETDSTLAAALGRKGWVTLASGEGYSILRAPPGTP